MNLYVEGVVIYLRIQHRVRIKTRPYITYLNHSWFLEGNVLISEQADFSSNTLIFFIRIGGNISWVEPQARITWGSDFPAPNLLFTCFLPALPAFHLLFTCSTCFLPAFYLLYLLFTCFWPFSSNSEGFLAEFSANYLKFYGSDLIFRIAFCQIFRDLSAFFLLFACFWPALPAFYLLLD